MAPRAETGFVRLHPPPPSPPKPATDSSLAEKPFLRPFLACSGLRFPVSAQRYRLRSLFGASVSGCKSLVPKSVRASEVIGLQVRPYWSSRIRAPSPKNVTPACNGEPVQHRSLG